jgi:outer membrane protein OmpA-like peptidoglycan-associated protein
VLGTGGPVSMFLDALQSRDLHRAAPLLAHDVRLTIPPLHYTRHGAQDVAEGLAQLFQAFGELHYDLRNRYLAPTSVTDEVVLIGRQVDTFLGAPPGRHHCVVPARLIIDHNDSCVIRITIWPDLGALRAALTSTDQVINLADVPRTSGMVAALRATIPRRRTRILVTRPREIRPHEPDLPGYDQPHEPGRQPRAIGAGLLTTTARKVPRAPLPKSVRQRRTALAGGTMLVAAGALASWVAVGALTLPGTSSAAPGESNRSEESTNTNVEHPFGTSGADSSGAPDSGEPDSGEPGTGPGQPPATSKLAPASQLAAGQNTVIIGSDLLFDTDSANLTSQARSVLADLIAQARRQRRRGTVVVSGYTDNVGSASYNLSLSRRRAAAVAAVLNRGLAFSGMAFVWRGYGESNPVTSDTTDAGRQANRRVTVAFPPPLSDRGTQTQPRRKDG